MSVARDGDGYALKLYVGEWQWLPQNRFCAKGLCVAKPSTACRACPVPKMTTAQRRLNIELVRAGTRHASDPGPSCTCPGCGRVGVRVDSSGKMMRHSRPTSASLVLPCAWAGKPAPGPGSTPGNQP